MVEAAARSGALITARWALEQGRGCFLVPGSIDAPASAGCLAFLREFAGEARIVTGVAELIDDLELVDPSLDAMGRGLAGGTVVPGRSVRDARSGRGQRRRGDDIWRQYADELAARTDLPIPSVLGTLTLLEIRGLIVAAYGRYRPAGALAAVAPGRP